MRAQFNFFVACVVATGACRGVEKEQQTVSPADPLPVTFSPTSLSLPIESYANVELSIAIGSGFGVDDLTFEIVQSNWDGELSFSADLSTPLSSGSHGRVRILAGARTSYFNLRALHGTTVVGELEFEVTAPDIAAETVQNRWFKDDKQIRVGSWGGGSSSPENLGTFPEHGAKKMAIVFIDTVDASFANRGVTTPMMAAAFDAWKAQLTPFFEEMTNWNATTGKGISFTDIDSYGPVRLELGWLAYINDLGARTPDNQNQPGEFFRHDGVWGFIFLSAFPNHELPKLYDYVVFVSAGELWPHARRSVGKVRLLASAGATGSRQRLDVGMVAMSWNENLGSIIAHEIGHNLGWLDEYGGPGDNPGNNLGGWSLMDYGRDFSQVTVAHKMYKDWITQPKVALVNFANGTPLQSTFTLRPVNTNSGSGFDAIEVRIASGLNYYFEYRPQLSAPSISDTNLPTRGLPGDGRSVVGTDVAKLPLPGDGSRSPDSLLLPTIREPSTCSNNSVACVKDEDCPGGTCLPGDILTSGVIDASITSYVESDLSATSPSEFSAELISVDSTAAQVRISYNAAIRPDPSLREWPSARGEWKSADLFVENAATATGNSRVADAPVAGIANTVVAVVRNDGAADAPSVTVDFELLTFNANKEVTAQASLGSATANVPKGTTGVRFIAPTAWIPEADESGHRCLRAKIRSYVLPGTEITEGSLRNNQAQSNYILLSSGHGSPAPRQTAIIQLANTATETAFVEVLSNATNPLFRSYVGSYPITLAPSATYELAAASEYAAEEFLADGGDSGVVEEFQHVPNVINIAAYYRSIDGRQIGGGGVSIGVLGGQGTRCDGAAVQQEGSSKIVSGVIREKADASGVKGGHVIVVAHDGSGVPHTWTAVVSQQGAYSQLVPSGYTLSEVIYVPSAGFVGCRDKII